jgi:hypothetical protein
MRTPTKVEVRRPQATAPRGPAAAPIKRRQKLEFETEAALDPFAGVDAEASIEELSGQISEAAKAAYTELERKQRENYLFADSTAYYRVLVFDNFQQAEAFAKGVGQAPGIQYMDGRAVCDRLGIAIPESDWRPKKAKVNSRLAALALPMAKHR